MTHSYVTVALDGESVPWHSSPLTREDSGVTVGSGGGGSRERKALDGVALEVNTDVRFSEVVLWAEAVVTGAVGQLDCHAARRAGAASCAPQLVRFAESMSMSELISMSYLQAVFTGSHSQYNIDSRLDLVVQIAVSESQSQCQGLCVSFNVKVIAESM